MQTIPCEHWRKGKMKGCGECVINAHARPTFGVCLTICEQYLGPDRAPLFAKLRSRYARAFRRTPGRVIRFIVHLLLDCIDAFIRPRDRRKLWIVDRVKTCGGCEERAILIDRYALHCVNQVRAWLHRNVKRQSQQAQEVLAGVDS